MNFYKFILVSLFICLGNTLVTSCDCPCFGFCELITEDSKVVEAKLINNYNGPNSSRYIDIEITDFIYGLDTLSYDTLTIIDYGTSCDVQLYNWTEIGDLFVFMFDELEMEESANFPVFNLYLFDFEYLQITGDSIAGIFVHDDQSFEFQKIEYNSFKNNIISTCELLHQTSSSSDLTIDFDVFPNPIHGNFTVRTTSEQEVKYVIYSNTGRVMESGKSIQEGTLNVDISHFSSGVYYLHFQMEEKIFSKKIIKN